MADERFAAAAVISEGPVRGQVLVYTQTIDGQLSS